MRSYLERHWPRLLLLGVVGVVVTAIVFVDDGAGGSPERRAASPAAVDRRPTPAPRCSSARRGLEFYRGRRVYWLARMGRPSPYERRERPRSCARVLELVELARRRAARARARVEWLNRDPRRAIEYVFGAHAGDALDVCSCETGGTFHVGATNGQYLGLFQMGSSERRLYGHGPTALEQAFAARRYFDASGRDWSPWSCRP